MANERFLEEIQEYFNVEDDGVVVTLSGNTKAGARVVIQLDKGLANSLFEQFEEFVIEFEVEEVVESRMMDYTYARSYSHEQGIEDFISYEKWLEAVLDNLR